MRKDRQVEILAGGILCMFSGSNAMQVQMLFMRPEQDSEPVHMLTIFTG